MPEFFIKDTYAELQKKHGAECIKIASQSVDMNVVDTGVFSLDYALMGGIPDGLFTIFAGPEASGKTTMAYKSIASIQRKYPDKYCVFVDMEGTFDKVWCRLNGVDLDRLSVFSGVCAEDAADMIYSVMDAQDVAGVVLDSIAAMTTAKELDTSTYDQQVAIRARLMAKCLNQILMSQIKRRLAGNPCTAIFINQLREKIGVMFGDPRVLPGGKQQNYQAVAQVYFRLKKQVQGKDDRGIVFMDHNEHAFTIKKSKIGNIIKEGEFILNRNNNHADLYASQIDDFKVVFGYAKKYGLLTGGGAAWSMVNIDHKFSNTAELRKYFIEDPLAYFDLKSNLISLRRQENGLAELPPDGYLYLQH